MADPVQTPDAPPERASFGDLATQIAGTREDLLSARRNEERVLQKQADTQAPKIAGTQAQLEGVATAGRERLAVVEAAKPEITPPPSRKLTEFLSPVQGESPEASVLKMIQGLGLLAGSIGGLARGDARGALAGLKGALAGWSEGDAARADRAFKDWQAKTDAALAKWAVERESYQGWFKNANMSVDMMLKGMELDAIRYGNDKAVAAAKSGTFETALKWLTDAQKHEDLVADHRLRLQQMHEDKSRQLDIQERLVDAKIAEMTDEAEPVNIDVGARRLMRGDAPTSIVRGIGKRATKRFEQIQRRAEELWREQGLSDEQIAANLSRARMTMAANTAALSRITQQEAQIAPFTETARDSLRRVRELSDKIQRGGVPWVNRWTLRARKGLAGDADVAALDYHLRVGATEVAKITSSATGGGGVVSDSARHEIDETINNAMTPEQVRRVIEGADFEMASRLRHIAEQKETLLGLGPAIGGPDKPPKQEFTLPDGTRVKER